MINLSASRSTLSARTVFLCRLLGLYFVICALAMLVQGRAIAEVADGVIRNRPLSFVTGLIAVAAGLAIVLVHNRWSGGPITILVTILGWILVFKGVLHLFLPETSLLAMFAVFRVADLIYLYGALDLAIGLALAISGFSQASPAATTHP
jgi:hypothetical protein